MKKYVKLLSIGLQTGLEYRFNYVVNSLIKLLSIFVIIFLWSSIYSTNHTIKNYTLQSMILYIFVVNTIFEIINTGTVSRKVSDDIRLGTLSAYLIRPCSYFFSQLADICAQTISKFPMVLTMYGLFGLGAFFYYSDSESQMMTISASSFLFFLSFILLGLTANSVE